MLTGRSRDEKQGDVAYFLISLAPIGDCFTEHSGGGRECIFAQVAQQTVNLSDARLWFRMFRLRDDSPHQLLGCLCYRPLSRLRNIGPDCRKLATSANNPATGCKGITTESTVGSGQERRESTCHRAQDGVRKLPLSGVGATFNLLVRSISMHVSAFAVGWSCECSVMLVTDTPSGVIQC